MRVLTKSSVLGTILIALAIVNFSVLDQIGVGLVDSVNEKFEELGADWMGVQVMGDRVDVEHLSSEIADIPDVRQAVGYWSTTVFDFSSGSATSPRPGAVLVGGATSIHWVMTSMSYDLAEHPYLFVFEEETETNAKFYLDTIVWIEGGPPGRGEVALSVDMANEHGVRVGHEFSQVFGATPFSPSGMHKGDFMVSGIYQRAYSDPGGDPAEVVIVGPDSALQAAPLDNRQVIVVQASLDNILEVAQDIVDRADALGYVLTTESFRVGMGRVGPGGGGPGAGSGQVGPGSAQGTGPPDLILFSNGDVLASALTAAENVGLWYRMLTTSAVALAVLGIAFVTAAMERKVRRDVGIRQAVGYPVKRIYRHWATVATMMGLAGAAIGISLVYILGASGLSQALLGLELTFRATLGILVAPVAAVVVYAIATLPTYARVLRSTPAENLRSLSE